MSGSDRLCLAISLEEIFYYCLWGKAYAMSSARATITNFF
jgi:hypothetical protein